ncbi:scopoletin glucosyltransferase-like [Quercus suber]|uniref:scopoletin glucosyltransferase-like n=1 Tax=Quercus suber TaxID=58331 RepID=UPI0032DE9CF1
MASESRRQLHVFFFPFLAHGHLIPTMDMAKLFAARGVKATFVTTPRNVPSFSKTRGINIDIQIIQFPAVEAGLPEGCENIDSIENSIEMVDNFFKATKMLKQPLEQLLQDFQPSCLVADMFFPWATDIAAKFGIPRLVFHGTCSFSLSVDLSLRQYEPHKKVSSDSEPFVIPNFPGEIKLIRMQLPNFIKHEVETDLSKLLKEVVESDLRSYGVVVNSFYELEPAYAEHYKKVIGRKTWHIGPVSLCNKNAEDRARRRKEASIDEHECLRWLGTKKPNSVVYICFGSIANFSDSQLMEIAMGLEASEQQFIWVVKKGKNEKEEEDWLPEGFEKKMEGKGLILRGWAPQVLLLDHEAVGGFVTHCGWNSTLEGVTAGVPMVTWPLSAEQFYNEKLVTQVLKVGVDVGVRRWIRVVGDSIKRDAIEKAVKRIMVGEEADRMRSRAKVLGEMAKRAVEEGGSSYSDLNALIEELRLHCP